MGQASRTGHAHVARSSSPATTPVGPAAGPLSLSTRSHGVMAAPPSSRRLSVPIKCADLARRLPLPTAPCVVHLQSTVEAIPARSPCLRRRSCLTLMALVDIASVRPCRYGCAPGVSQGAAPAPFRRARLAVGPQGDRRARLIFCEFGAVPRPRRWAVSDLEDKRTEVSAHHGARGRSRRVHPFLPRRTWA